MPSIHGEHNGRAALIPVAIIDAARYKQHKEAAAPILGGVKAYRALIDTGATSTMISKRVVDDLSLQPVTKIEFHSLDGRAYRPACLFNLALYENLPLEKIDDGQQNPGKISVCKKLLVGGVLDGGVSFDVLVGMDIISTWNFTIRNDGTFEIAF